MAAIGVLVVLMPSTARADELEDLVYARDAYNNSDYDVAIQRFTALLDRQPAISPALVEPSRKYLFASLLLTDHRDEAVAMLERILRSNPEAQFAPREFSGPVTRLVAETRARLGPELERIRAENVAAARASAEVRERARQALLESLSRERVTYQVSRTWMFLPFGVGQFVNGDYAIGAVFAVIETAALATAVSTGIAMLSLGPPDYSPTMGACLRRVCLPLEIAQIASWSVFALAVAGGAIQANVAYRPERVTYRRRTPLIDPARLQISFAPSPDGASIGVGGRF